MPSWTHGKGRLGGEQVGDGDRRWWAALLRLAGCADLLLGQVKGIGGGHPGLGARPADEDACALARLDAVELEAFFYQLVDGLATLDRGVLEGAVPALTCSWG